MKILMVSDIYPPNNGGLGRYVQLLSKELTNRGHKVSVVTVGYPGLPEYDEQSGIRIYRLSTILQNFPLLYKEPRDKKPPPIEDFMISRKIQQIVKKDKPDIIHSHGWITYSVLPLKKKLRVPLVSTLHDYGFICPKTTFLKGNTMCGNPFTGSCINCGKSQYGIIKSAAAYFGVKTKKVKLNSVDKFIAGSVFVKKTYSQYAGLDNKDIVIIPNFYAIEPGHENQVTDRLPEAFILFVGTLMPDKGVDTLIEAYLRQITGTKLVLIGARHPEYEYERTENIWILENASRELLMKAYQRCEFVVLPSILLEVNSMVALEAMSHKKAVIATDRGAFPEIIEDQESGILVSPHNLTALSDALTYLLANHNIANTMGYKGYDLWQEKFSPEIIVPKIENLYESLIHDNQVTNGV